MAKFIRRSAIVGAAALTGTLAFSAPAVADSDPFIDGTPITDMTPEVTPEGGPAVYRFADSDRIGTALKAAQATNDDHWGDTVIIANSQVYADALAAGPLADTIDAPVLLNAPGNALRADVMAYVNANFSNVVVLGGTDVFGDDLVDSLETAGKNVVRVDGPNRYQTAVAIADYTVSQNDEGTFQNVYLASGKNFPDALAAGAAAANNSGIVLLTKGYEGLDSQTYAALNGTGSIDWMEDIHGSFIAVGGPAASALENGYLGDPIEADQEIVGANRYETAVELATKTFDGAAGETENVTIASGQNFPDGVVAGAYAANADGPLLLTQENSLQEDTANYMINVADRDNIEQVFVFGGTNSVSKGVTNEIRLLEWTY